MRRLAVTNHSDRPREIEVTSYAEIVLAPAGRRPRPPRVRQAVRRDRVPRRERGPALPAAAARAPTRRRAWAVHVLEPGGPAAGAGGVGDRPRALPRPRPRRPTIPQALDGRPLSGTTGAVLDPIVSLRQRIRLAPGRLRAAVVRHRDGRQPRRRRWPWPRSTTTRAPAARTFALAFAHAQSGLRHLGISSEEALLFERLASRVLYADGSLRAAPEVLARNALGQEGLWPHGISGDLPILLVRVVEEDDLPLVRQVLQAQEYWRLKGLSADVVILNEHPRRATSTRCTPRSTALLDNGPWRAWKHRPGGAYLLRGDRMTEAERDRCWRAWRARSCSGDRGELAQPARPARTPSREEPRRARRRSRRAADARAAPAAPTSRCPPLALANGLGGFADGRPRVRDRPRGDAGDAAALGQRHRQPALRHGRHRVGRGLHLGGEQPREPPHAVRQRPRHRPHRARRSSCATTRPARPGRRRRARCARTRGERALRDPARRRASRASRATATASASELEVFVDRARPGEVLAPHADQRERTGRGA